MAASYIGRTDLPPGLRNNNPGDIRPAAGDNWLGMIGTANNFVVFQDISWGLRALATDLLNKIQEGLDSITNIITTYAPPSENDTASYIAAVAASTGLDPNEQLGTDEDTLQSLMRAIITHEIGSQYTGYIADTDIQQGISMVNDNLLSLVQSVPAAIQAAASNLSGSLTSSGITPDVNYWPVAGAAGALALVLWIIYKK